MEANAVAGSSEGTPLISADPAGELRQSSQTNNSELAPPTSSDIFGYFCLFLTGCLFATAVLIMRVIESQHNVPVPTLVFIRSIVHVPQALTYIFAFPKPRRALGSLRRDQILLLILRGTMGSSSLFLLCLALSNLRSGDAVALYCLSPAFTLVLSSLILKESTSLVAIGAVVCSFSGAWLISRPSNAFEVAVSVSTFTSNHVYGCIFAILSAFCASSAYVTIRALGTSVNFMLFVLASSIANAIFALVFGGYETFSGLETKYGSTALLLTVLVGFVSFAAQIAVNLGFQRCKAAPGNVVFTVELPIAYLLSILILHESPSWSGTIGAVLIAAATISVCIQHVLSLES